MKNKFLWTALAIAGGIIYYRKKRAGRRYPTTPDTGNIRETVPKMSATAPLRHDQATM